LEDAFTEQQAHQGVIEPGERDEANPWLRRTQWAVYLSGLDPQQLVNCVQRPSEADTDDDRAAAAIWDSMEAVARISQKVCSRAGHTIRIEAVRTEREQTPHTPLQAYMDEENIVRHTIPWQQVLMFFVRTQTHHDWVSPHYRFTERQRKAWRALWRLARADQSRSNSVSEAKYPVIPNYIPILYRSYSEHIKPHIPFTSRSYHDHIKPHIPDLEQIVSRSYQAPYHDHIKTVSRTHQVPFSDLVQIVSRSYEAPYHDREQIVSEHISRISRSYQAHDPDDISISYRSYLDHIRPDITILNRSYPEYIEPHIPFTFR